jgi:hypothetical protein
MGRLGAESEAWRVVTGCRVQKPAWSLRRTPQHSRLARAPHLQGNWATGDWRETVLKERGATCRAAIQWWWNGKAGLGAEAEGFGLGRD